jgi:hypothetical protein
MGDVECGGIHINSEYHISCAKWTDRSIRADSNEQNRRCYSVAAM